MRGMPAAEVDDAEALPGPSAELGAEGAILGAMQLGC
jgi:hypothetical protein